MRTVLRDNGPKSRDKPPAQADDRNRPAVTGTGRGAQLSPPRPVIAARGIGKCFGERSVLSDVDLAVGPGCVFGLLGRNGAGKTTLLRVLLGLTAPTAGSSAVLGMNSVAEGTEVRRACGTVLGAGAVYEELSVWDNVEFAARAWGVPKARRRDAVNEALVWAGIAERRSDRARALSQGMRQRVALARAVVHEPRVLVLDEPTTGLDVPAANALRDHVRRWSDQTGAGVILSSHDLYEMDRLCDRIGLLEEQTLIIVERSGPGSSGGAPGWALRVTGTDPALIARLVSRGALSATVDDGVLEAACASLGDAKALRADATNLGAPGTEIVLRHDGDLAGVFTHDASTLPEGGLGCAR